MWKNFYSTWQGRIKYLIIILSLTFLMSPVMGQNQSNAVPSQNYVYFTALGFIIGSILTGTFNYLISKKNSERTMRLAFISTIFSYNENIDQFNKIFSEIHSRINQGYLKLKDDDLLAELQRSRSILIFSLSINHYERLQINIREKKWNEAQKVILEYLSGDW